MTTSASSGAEETTPLRVELGFGGVVKLVAAPVTHFELDDPGAVAIDELEKEIPVRGSWSGFGTRPVKATLIWIVAYSKGDSAEFAVEGEMQPDGDKFEFKVGSGPPKIKVFDHHLFGAGAVGFRLSPQFPHAGNATLAPSGVTFDNPVTLETGPFSMTAPTMGKQVELSLRNGPLVDKLFDADYVVRLGIDEIDTDKTEAKAKDNFHADWTWDKTNRGASVPWLIGCTIGSNPSAVVLQYGEANEVGGYEFGYTLGVTKKNLRVVTAKGPELLCAVPRPWLRDFRLTYTSFLPIKIGARGHIEGFAREAVISVVVSLWRRSGGGAYQRIEAPVTAELSNGWFEIEDLYTFPMDRDASYLDPLGIWISSLAPANFVEKCEPALFGTVRLNEAQLGGATKKLPIASSIVFDRFQGFDDARGVLAGPHSATAICSVDADNGAELVDALRPLLYRPPR